MDNQSPTPASPGRSLSLIKTIGLKLQEKLLSEFKKAISFEQNLKSKSFKA